MPGIRGDLWGSVPGQGVVSESFESNFRWGRDAQGVIVGGHVSGAARDLTNTPTTILRSGLLLGRITATKLLTNYSATATDGSQVVDCVLMPSIRMVDFDGSDQLKFIWALAAGPVKAANLIGLDNNARRQMRGRFIFDDDYANKLGFGEFLVEVNKAANYTVVAADAGTLFTASAAAVFTLPTLAAGLGPFGFLNLANTDMGVASALGGDIVFINDAGANSLTFSTATEKIGGFLRVYANTAGTKWYVEKLCSNTVTVVT